MTKLSEQKNFGFDNRKKIGPVECLGMTFEDDEARRAYFTEKLREKLKDPEFRKIEGFPIGEDEDILALSDPPYYTACPNPFIQGFVKYHGKKFHEKEKYHREPLGCDIEESRNNPYVNAHSYPTKTPHQAIMRLILNFTNPGDIVLDAFAGTGMTAVAAQLCGNPEIKFKIKLSNENKNIIWGDRHAIIGDLDPAATYIARNFNLNDDWDLFDKEVDKISKEIRLKFGWLYKTHHKNGNYGEIKCVLWSDVYLCPDCNAEIIFWDVAVNMEKSRVEGNIRCKSCNSINKKSQLDKFWIHHFDSYINETVKKIKSIPVLIIYAFGGKNYEKKPDNEDFDLINKIEEVEIQDWFPTNKMPKGFNTEQPKKSHGLTHVHHFFTKRNLIGLAFAWNKAKLTRTKFLLTSLMYKSSVLCAPLMSNYFAAKKGKTRGGWVGKERTGTLYCPSIHSEVPILPQIKTRKKAVKITAAGSSLPCIATFSATSLQIPDNSIDYVFTDPPFGANRMYSEINFLWEAWLKVKTDNKKEAIENSYQNKGLSEYRKLMLQAFNEYHRVLKPGRWISVEFSNTRSLVWNTLQAIVSEAGFVVADVRPLNKKQGSIEAYTSPTAVKQDLVISAYKPNGGLEKRFLKKADTEEGVWDFIKTHLNNLPIVKPKGGKLEFITERDPRILYDRTVAFYIRHGIPVPLSSPEFQAGLADRFPERDGMYFLPDQAAEYDKKRIKMEGLGQMVIWVEDERSAADWLRNFLKNKPSKYQEMMPEFFEKLNEAWKKWETRPELRALLDQYFLCYDGQENVPPQIHSYLSTNFKELRKLPADDPSLRLKAKDRWYVPDPRKNADVEKLREKRLLDEFWTYLPLGYDLEAVKRRVQSGQETVPGMESPPPKIPKGKRLKLVRTEAVRVGFKQCYQIRDYQTIIAVAHYIPEDVVNGDDQLQMIYDSAVTRSGLEI